MIVVGAIVCGILLTQPQLRPIQTNEKLSFQPFESLPDYNNLDYEFSCEDGFGCMLVAENGFRFYGEEKDGVVTFHSIPYAEPPTGDLRWKAPVLIKSKFDIF